MIKPLTRKEQVELTKTTIIIGAIDLFLEDGFKSASINVLAKRIGCSKETIYKYFTDKEGLFLAAIDKMLDDILNSVVDLDIKQMDLRAGLRHVSYRTLERLCTGKYTRLRMLIFTSAFSRPELGREYYDYIEARSYKILADFFKYHIKNKSLKKIDPDRTAKYFWGMMLHHLLLSMDTKKISRISKPKLRQHADQIIDDFLLAFRK